VRIYLYTYVILLFPAGNYTNPILRFRPDFDGFNGASESGVLRLNYFSTGQARFSPESKNRRKNFLNIFLQK